jgi:zinc-ribbon domain
MNQTTYTVGGKIFCSNCGNEVIPGKTFCSRCGTQFSFTPPPMHQQTPPIQQSSAQQQMGQTSNATPHFSPQHAQQQPNHQMHAEPQPLRVIAMQKKFALVACMKDLILPGNGFIYTEKMVEGGLVGLITIPLTVWAFIYYVQLWMSDVLTNLKNIGGYGYSPDFSTSNGFLTAFLTVSIIWFGIRCLWLWYKVNEHNKQIENLADMSQIVTFVDGK